MRPDYLQSIIKQTEYSMLKPLTEKGDYLHWVMFRMVSANDNRKTDIRIKYFLGMVAL